MSLRVKSLILDLDGTLLDSKPGILQSFGQAVATVFPDAPFDLSKVKVGPPIRQMCLASFPQATSGEIEALARAYRAHYDREGCLQTCLFEDGINVLCHCREKKVPIDIATNKPFGVTNSILSRLEISHFFRRVVSVDSTAPPFSGKTAMIQHILQSEGLDPAHTLFVGDTAEDAAAAAAGGIPFVWAAYGYGTLNEDELKLAVAKITKLKQLLSLF